MYMYCHAVLLCCKVATFLSRFLAFGESSDLVNDLALVKSEPADTSSSGCVVISDDSLFDSR